MVWGGIAKNFPSSRKFIYSNLDVLVGLPIHDVVEEEPGLRPAQPHRHLHRHGLRPVVHLGHLQDPQSQLHAHGPTLRQIQDLFTRQDSTSVQTTQEPW